MNGLASLRRYLLPLLGLAALLSTWAGAETPAASEDNSLDELIEKWRNQYVRWITTDEEKSQFDALKAPAEKLRFIDWFWLRRDPTPGTPQNEFREEHMRRYQFAVKNFGAGKPGWSTERGRIYILFGPPNSIQRNPMGRNAYERPSEIWTYNSLPNTQLPGSLDLNFVDFAGSGDYQLVSSIDQTAPVRDAFGTLVMSQLEATALRRPGEIRTAEQLAEPGIERRISDPDNLVHDFFEFQRVLDEVRKSPSLDLPPLEEVVKSTISFESLGLAVEADAYRDQQGQAYVPVTLAVPYRDLKARDVVTSMFYSFDLLAELQDPAGQVLAQHQDQIHAELPRQRFEEIQQQIYLYQFNFAAPPGSYRVQVVVRDNLGNKVGTARSALEVPDFSQSRLSLSSVTLAEALYQLPDRRWREVEEKEPFLFGDYKVVPSLDRRYPVGQRMGWYFQVYNYQLDPQQKRGSLRVEYFVRRRGGNLVTKVPSSYLSAPERGQLGIQSVLELKGLAAGDYTLVAVVEDLVNQDTARASVDFQIYDSGGLSAPSGP
jgi:GWxTD domain-containing protein